MPSFINDEWLYLGRVVVFVVAFAAFAASLLPGA